MTGIDALRRVAPLLVVAGLLALWQIGAIISRQEYWPGLQEIFPALVASIRTGEIWPDLFGSLRRLAIGFSLGVAFGVPLGLVAGRSKRVENIVAPLLGLIYPVPKAALLPLVMLWFGAGDLSKILIIVATVSLPLIYHAQHGAQSVEHKLIWSARAAGMPVSHCLWRVVLPAAAPGILTGVRVSVVIACVVVFFCEMIAPGDGLGDILVRASRSFQSVQMFVPVVTISALGYGLDRLVAALRARYATW